MEDSKPKVLSQDKAYRRGLVLGFTMAEIMVLILFALLLIFASTHGRLKNDSQANMARIAELEAIIKTLEDIIQKNPKGGTTVTNIIQEIHRCRDEIVVLNAEIDRLKARAAKDEALGAMFREIARQLGKDWTPGEIADKLAKVTDLMKENETLKNQLVQLGHQVKDTGRGNEFPSCWATKDGKTESIYKLVMGKEGITIIDRLLPHRAREKTQLPISSVPYNMELSIDEFRGHLRPLYEWSIAHSCRFYVIMATSELRISFNLVNTANGFFYPDSRIQYSPN